MGNSSGKPDDVPGLRERKSSYEYTPRQTISSFADDAPVPRNPRQSPLREFYSRLLCQMLSLERRRRRRDRSPNAPNTTALHDPLLSALTCGYYIHPGQEVVNVHGRVSRSGSQALDNRGNARAQIIDGTYLLQPRHLPRTLQCRDQKNHASCSSSLVQVQMEATQRKNCELFLLNSMPNLHLLGACVP